LRDSWRDAMPGQALDWDVAAVVTLATMFVGSIAQLAAGTYNPFIYFRF
jgi:hypothetical protein